MPAAVSAGSYSQQGLRVAVNDYIKDPKLIQARMLDIMRNEFIMEDLLRNAGGNDSGVVRYEQDSPLFADSDPMIVAEAGEIPLLTGGDGLPKAAFTVKYGAGIEISREARSRNKVDQIDKRMKQVRNSFTRLYEKLMFSALSNAGCPTMPASAAWDIPTTNIRTDVIAATSAVREANQSGATAGPAVEDYLGFDPDTLVMSTRTRDLFFGNDSVTEVYGAGFTYDTKNPVYTGTLENDFVGLRVLVSRFMQDNEVWVMERKTVGGWSDEYPFSTEPLYPDKPRQVWRTDVTRRTAIFIDQPKAAIKITGVNP